MRWRWLAKKDGQRDGGSCSGGMVNEIEVVLVEEMGNRSVAGWEGMSMEWRWLT